MNYLDWILFFLALQGIHFLGTWKLYKKAGRKPWEALVPIYNGIVLMQIINRPKWWVVLLFIPVINLLMFPIIWVETARSFGKNSTLDTWLSFLTLGFYLYVINYAQNPAYVSNRSLKPKSALGEWINSILFAIIAATLVHTYVIQPFTIPTSSLEKSLLVGDFLFVSKFHYGARLPMTPIAAPMVHDTLPVIKKRSYLKKPSFPYVRIPGFQKIKRNDIVVFNWPADTVQQFFKRPDRKIRKPIDKKSNYVKRCVAVPGDRLEIKDGDLYINGTRSVMPERAKPQFFHIVDTKGRPLSENSVYDKYRVRRGEAYLNSARQYVLNLDEENAKKLRKNPKVTSVVRNTRPKNRAENVFPSIKMGWNRDHFGPIYIPEKGSTVALTKESLPFYRRIIKEYEHNDLRWDGDDIYINGKRTDTYTFQQDYYWMMGDNRHNSEDSRYWGYVPFDHVVGKPVFVWFSWDSTAKGFDKIRWERLFTTVHGKGPIKSYFVYFLVIWALYLGYKRYRKATS